APEEDASLASSMAARFGEIPPGSYALMAGRFTRFSELAGFSETVQALPGIQGVSIQQFQHGMVSMRIQYDSPIPFMTRLKELRQFKPEVREIGPAQYEMLIFAEARGVVRAPAPEAATAPEFRDALAPFVPAD